MKTEKLDIKVTFGVISLKRLRWKVWRAVIFVRVGQRPKRRTSITYYGAFKPAVLDDLKFRLESIDGIAFPETP